MKRLLTSATLFLCSLLTFAQFSGSGSGTENDPYCITKPIHLSQMRNFLNQSGVYFKLMAPIKLTDFLEDENPSQGWQPVGNSSSAAFKGVLDGNGMTVSGLWITRKNSDYVGLFGYTSGATIKNLTVKAKTIQGKDNVAIISGYSDNTKISGCSASGTVKGASCVGSYVGQCLNTVTLSGNYAKVSVEATGDYVGGFVGRGSITISDCKLDGTIIKGANYVGGCCGSASGNITNSYIRSDITGSKYIGGICGQDDINYIKGCGFIGDIIGNESIGGVVGNIKSLSRFYDGYVKNSFAIGKVSAIGNNVGGLVGHDDGYGGIISNCYFSGSVSAGNNVGGLVGYKYSGEISKSYAVGSVAGTKNVGGLIGHNGAYHNTIKSSVAINTRVTATEGNVGRIVGKNDGGIAVMGSSEENLSYNRTIVISQGVAQEIEDDLLNGTSASAKTLKYKATYLRTGWDFNDTWEIQEGECYPYMKTQTAPPIILSKVESGATTISGKCVDGGTVTLTMDGKTQEMASSGHEFSFTVSPLQAGHEVRISAKANGKELSYYTTEIVSFLGKGTEKDPYQVYTAADLTYVFRWGYYKLMNDIDLTSYIDQYYGSEGWESIGREGSETINFNGDGHKITGLWCNSTRNNTGLFSCFANGYIKNLTVETAKGKQVKGGNYTGIIIGKLINGEMINCKAYGTVADGTPVGGMIGKLDGGKLVKCQTNVTINVTGGKSYVGGLAGEVTGDVDQCLSGGTLTATGQESYVGGLIGLNNSSSDVINCYSNAITNSSYNAAGLVAYNYGMVEQCYASGDIFSKNYGAGVIGYNDGSSAVVTHCVATSNKIDVKFESQSAQSGGYGQRIIGGFKNGAPAPEMDNYALKTMQVSVNNHPQPVEDDIFNGVAKKETLLKKASTYENLGWDMSAIWNLKADKSYPYLRKNLAIVGVSIPTSLIIEKGKTETLTPTLYPSTSTLDKSVTWKSSNTKIATVTSSGKVKGVKAGTATITCTSVASGVSTTCLVTVGYVKLDQTEVVLKKGKTVTLTPTFYPSSMTDKNVTWESSDTKVATVSSDGEVKGVKTGTATITCTSVTGGFTATCQVTIGLVNLDKYKLIVQKGETATLTPTVYPSSLADKSVKWKSSKTSVATVSSDGVVTGVKAGTATITCTSVATGLSRTCAVTVGYVKLDKAEAIVEKTKTLKLKATVYPSSLTDKSVTWKSSNTSVATVSSDGVVTGVKAGTATITCTSNATGLSTTCNVTVGYVKLDKTEIAVNKGKTVTLKATVYPSSLSDRSVTWKSSNTDVATVSSSGKVKGVKAGTATITCTSNATGLSTTCNVTVGYVKLDQTEVTVKKGKTVTLTPTVYPSSLEDKSVTWTSSDRSVATVTSTGKVKGIAAGTATITCTSIATGLSTTCTVTVTETSGGRASDGDNVIDMNENPTITGPFDVYDLRGLKVRHQVNSLDGLPDGIYIVNGRKVLKK